MATNTTDKETPVNKSFASNVNAGGKLHRLLRPTTEFYHDKRAICGWRAGSVVAKAMFCKRMPTQELCKKCFREISARPSGPALEDDEIEKTE